MEKMRATAIAASVILSAGVLLLLGSTSSGGQNQGPAWWWNPWEPGQSTAWDLREMTLEQRQRMMRHWTFMNKQVPLSYLEATNDVGYSIKSIAAGGPLYTEHCQGCHGPTGLGDGEAAGDLTPSPALLAHLIQEPIAVDQYLLWTISEGGKEFGTAMPSFRDTLTQNQIWDIIAYMRAGFPKIGSEEAGKRSGAESGTSTHSEDDATSPSGGGE